MRAVSETDAGPHEAAGRMLFSRPWHFVRGAAAINDLPRPDGIEVAFAGRSNVGKSSLLNALTGQGTIARISNTPGRTQELNFFSAGTGLTIVDMPGYGFARAPKRQVRDWTRLVFAFLKGRASLRRVYVLVDARHGLKPNDLAALDLLDGAAVSYQLVLTKADKVRPEALTAVAEETAAAIAKRPAAHPRVVVTSAVKGVGLAELRGEVAGLLAPTGGEGGEP